MTERNLLPVLPDRNPVATFPSMPTTSDRDSRFAHVDCVVVKVTDKCNLSCSYCYENISNSHSMEIDDFRNLVDRVLVSSEADRVNFLLHGGEPSLIGDSWLEEAVTYANEKSALLSKTVLFSMQSNVLAISDRRARLFAKLNIALGASLDGPPAINDAMRGRAQLATDNFIRLKAAGVRVGVLMTINHSNYSHFPEICRWLEEDLEETDFKANVVYAVGKGDNLPDLKPIEIHRASSDILDHMIRTGGQALVEHNISLEVLRFFETERDTNATLCQEQNCQAGRRVVGITPHGAILPCGRFQWDDAEHWLGILSQPLAAESNGTHSSKLHAFHEAAPDNWINCNSCEAKKICSYGCQAFIVRSKSKANVECLPTRMRFNYFEENRDVLAPLADVLRERRKRDIIAYSDGRYLDTAYNDGAYTDYYSDGYTDKGWG